MSIYTVHAPPPNEAKPDPERFVFIRDGFYLWAFVLGPIWLLLKRLWLSLLIYLVVIAVLHAGLWLIKATPTAHSFVTLLVHLLVGLEAATLQRWTLNRRRWTQVGVVSAKHYEAAERRFFDSWVSQLAWQSARTAPQAPSSQQLSAISPGMAQSSSDIIGLFPEPQSRQ